MKRTDRMTPTHTITDTIEPKKKKKWYSNGTFAQAEHIITYIVSFRLNFEKLFGVKEYNVELNILFT